MAQLRSLINSLLSINKYRNNPNDFTRKRKLTFPSIACLIMQKSVKSLQIKLNEYVDEINKHSTISASAYTQARAKLSYKFFRDASHEIYTEGYYEEETYKKYKGHRLLAIDGSQIRLPDTEEIKEEFGEIKLKNQHTEGKYTSGLCSTMYDMLNGIVVDGVITKSTASERDVASMHLNFARANDLIILDRGYPSYSLFAEIRGKKADFICRCSRNSFNVVKEFLEETKVTDKIVDIFPSEKADTSKLPKEFKVSMQVRLIKITLSTGEIEVLMTSLTNKVKYTKADFKNLYAKRWSVETLYNLIKNRLSLENFTGKTVEAIKQDFYSTLLLTNLESDIISSTNKKLLKKSSENKYKQKANKSVSFNAIKNYALELFLEPEADIDIIFKRLEVLFLTGVVPIRENRTNPRDKTTNRKTANFAKRMKKHVF